MSLRLIARPGHLTEGMELRLHALDCLCFPADQPYPKRHDTYWWLYTVNGNDRAFCGLKKWFGGVYFLCRSGVSPQERGKGLQLHMIRMRERYARRLGGKLLVTYTTAENLASSNSLINAGFKLYEPAFKYAGAHGILYWRKEL